MNERDIFLAALEQPTAQQRSEYLRLACADDTSLRQRVDELLRMHEQTGEFLQVPLVERLAAGITALEDAEETAPQPAETRKAKDELRFLSPSQQPGSLGRMAHYEVQQIIGRGGMGIVLRAFDEKLHRVVAIKVMAASLASNAVARKRFLREARAAAAVCHDHIVTIHAVEGESDDLPYLVMHCVSGMSLQERIDRDGPLELHEILRIGMQTAAGLAAAHAQGLIHRDIKPANILLDNGVERVKITDFGLARAAADASISQSGIVVGTPQYMAPEQARGEALDARTDLFSLGSVLYAMCTGRAPFRAGSSMATLKRVCDDAPSPIREANADIPDWLIALIDKLQAKDPGDRFQTAAEVSALLGQQLARLQHSAVLPKVTPAQPIRPRAPGRHWRRWPIAAGVLLILAATFGMAEGTGATKITASVIRLLTPEGTLVVEVTDPGMKVTIDGDGGLVITGVGQHEVRLKPGSYKLQADKNGKPVTLDQELVTITRGDKQVVRVRLQAAAPAPAASSAERNAFVVLTGKGTEVRKFDTLAEAVQGSSDGDTIEIRGNGPFVTETVSVNAALTIRAGEGFRPVIRLSVTAAQSDRPLFEAHKRLVLEGLDLFRPKGSKTGTVVDSGAFVATANCRFHVEGVAHCILTADSWTTRNCLFLDPEYPTLNGPIPVGAKYDMHNCVVLGFPFNLPCWISDAVDVPIRLTHNTIVANGFGIQVGEKTEILAGAKGSKPIRFDVSGTIFVSNLLWVHLTPPFLAKHEGFDPEKSGEALLRNLMDWNERENLHAPGSACITWARDQAVPQPSKRVKTLAEWHQLWGLTDTGSLEGDAKYQGGDVRGKFATDPDRLTPEDFRLRTDSAGYRAGKDGKDLGADVDLVGPGPAYERWKKTPEYQEWLKETGQLRTKSPKPESQAFVVLTGKGTGVRNFDTLAEAVQGSSEGDTIEIRGNGPFVEGPITIAHALTIRAGGGFRPVLKLNPNLKADSSLVLEGLELQRWGPEPRDGGYHEALVYVSQGPHTLHLANCRFKTSATVGPCVTNLSSQCVIRNCEFLSPCGFNVFWYCRERFVAENCLLAGVRSLEFAYSTTAQDDEMSVRITRSTLLCADRGAVGTNLPPEILPSEARLKPVQLVASASIFDTSSVLLMNGLGLSPAEIKSLPAEESAARLRRMLTWRDRLNLYTTGGSSITTYVPELLPTGPQNLAEWNRFWAPPEGDAIEGRIRYQGGDLLAKLSTAPEKLTPEDFRLRPDSAGYRAGPDGKDLGADVDLVGPGPAYERWKKTPEYEEWLKETAQKK